MKLSKKILALISAFAIAFSLTVPAHATVGDLVSWAKSSWNELLYNTYAVGTDGTENFWYLLFQPDDGECDHVWVYNVDGYRYCETCGVSFDDYYDAKYSTYVSGLDSTIVTSGVLLNLFFCQSSSGVLTPIMDTSDVINGRLGNVVITGNSISCDVLSSSNFGLNFGGYFTVPESASYDISFGSSYGLKTSSSGYTFYYSSDGGTSWTFLGSDGQVGVAIDDSYESFDYNDLTKTLSSSLLYCFAFYYNVPSAGSPAVWTFDVLPSVSKRGGTSAPESTTRPTSISGNYGIIGDDGQLITIGTQTIVNEGSSTYYSPVTSTTYDLSGWIYDYSTRTYDLTLSTGDTVTVEYADESVNITEGDTVYNVYYLVEQEAVDPDECTHDYTCVSTTLPSCTGSGLDTYTCSLCGNTYTQTVAATGHTWEIKQSVTTQYDDTGELITEGYTIYECSTCGEQYKSTDGASPPSGSDSSSGSSGSTGSFWEKVGTLFGTVADGVISMIETTIGKILDALISLVEILSEKFNAVLDAVLSLFDRVPDLFGGFTAFLAAVFPFLPEEFMDVLLLGLIAFVFAALFRYLTKGK